MTDYSGWTDEQVNEEIARRLWANTLMTYEQWDDIIARSDYTHDWWFCGGLLAEMGKTALNKTAIEMGLSNFALIGYPEHGWSCKIGKHIARSDTPQRAICEAWLAWKEQG